MKKELQGLSVPKRDPLFAAFADRFIVLDGADIPIAIVATADEETALRYGKAREPDCNSVVGMATLLHERLWSDEGRAKISWLMGLPVVKSGEPADPRHPASLAAASLNRAGGFSSTYRRDFASAWREVARGIVGELNDKLKALTVHRPPVQPRLAIRPEERDAANNELMAFEARMQSQFAGASA